MYHSLLGCLLKSHVPGPTQGFQSSRYVRILHFGKAPAAEGKKGPPVGAWLHPWVGLCHTVPMPALPGPSGASWHELCSLLSHPPFPVGVGLAGAQAKHLRLISGTNGACAGPRAWALLGGRDRALFLGKAEPALVCRWGCPILPLSEKRFRTSVGRQRERRSTHVSFDHKGR